MIIRMSTVAKNRNPPKDNTVNKNKKWKNGQSEILGRFLMIIKRKATGKNHETNFKLHKYHIYISMSFVA